MSDRPSAAIILAAGRGARMFPAAPAFSKTLLRVGGLPVVAHAARAAAPLVERLVLVTNPHTSDDVFRAVAHNLGPYRVTVTTAVQPEPLGVAHAIAVGISALAEDSAIVVLCGDNLMLDGCNVAAVLRCVTAGAGPDAAVNFAWTYREFDAPQARQLAVFEPTPAGSGRLIEKPPLPPSRVCWCGPIAFRSSDDARRRISRLRPSGRGEYEVTELINTYLTGDEARRFPLEGVWFDVGHEQALREANRVLSGLVPE